MDERRLVPLAVVCFLALACATATVGATLYGTAQQSRDIRDAIVAADEDRMADECRAQLTSNLADAQTDYLLALGEGLRVYAEGGNTAVALDEVSDTGAALSDARDARVGFEQDPAC